MGKKQAEVFGIEAYVNCITEDGNVLMRKRGLKDGPTLRVSLDNFSEYPDIAQHDGVAFKFDSDCEIKMSDDHSYCKFLGDVDVVDVKPGAGAPSGIKISAADAMSILTSDAE